MNFRCGAWEQKDRMGLESFSSEAAWKGGGSYDVSHFRHSFGNFPNTPNKTLKKHSRTFEKRRTTHQKRPLER